MKAKFFIWFLALKNVLLSQNEFGLCSPNEKGKLSPKKYCFWKQIETMVNHINSHQ